MKRISSFLLGMATGAMLLHAATLYHVVRASDGVHFIAKQPARLSETYVDIRSFSMTDWAAHPQLASALVQANQQQLIGESAARRCPGKRQSGPARLAEEVTLIPLIRSRAFGRWPATLLRPLRATCLVARSDSVLPRGTFGFTGPTAISSGHAGGQAHRGSMQ